MIDILDPVPAAGDDVDMPDGSDHSNPLFFFVQSSMKKTDTALTKLIPNRQKFL